MPSRDFLRPKLQGRRFDDGEIPLEFLSDLAALREMVLEVAKWRFLQRNPDRQRSPRGFTKDVHLKLTRLEGGSATPVIALSIAQPPSLIPHVGHEEYFVEAIEYIIDSMNAPGASSRSVDNGTLPRKYLSYFDRIGRNLQDGEYIDFSVPSERVSARLDSAKRRDLIAASRIRELTQEVSLRGSVSETDQDRMTFELQPIYGNKVPGPIQEQHLETILEVFNGYREGTRALVQGVGRYDQQNRLIRLESVEHITTLDPLDVPARLDEFRDMKDGWLDGKGVAPTRAGLDRLAASFERNYPDDLPLPHTYPTPEGGVRMEWDTDDSAIVFEIDPDSQGAYWLWFDRSSDSDDERTLNLNNMETWEWIASEIRNKIGSEE